MTTNMEEMLEDSVLLQCRVNNKPCELEIAPGTTLLELLREEMRLTGTHMGCMTGHCGACTVLIDGQVAKSCITLAATVQRKTITTLEGLKDAEGKLTPIQQAFWDEAGLQCAFCAPGMVLTATELLKSNAEPTDDEIRTAMAGNLCRCTGYQSIVRAVRAAARVMKQLK
ncbi:MAG TPA: (2Fe-2S)-binding protein [Steroidobacteraceae bacterium]|nr:(2Fe-2S)-binding protein [Steroidobacteraceae bacterium]